MPGSTWRGKRAVVADAVTLTIAEAERVPPAPTQVNVKVVSLVMGADWAVPLRPTGPLQPPEARQLSASFALQASVVVPEETTVLGEADSVIVGAGVAGGSTVTVTLLETVPAIPVHESR